MKYANSGTTKERQKKNRLYGVFNEEGSKSVGKKLTQIGIMTINYFTKNKPKKMKCK